MNRKTFAWILSVCMAFGLSACGLPQGGSSSLDPTPGGSTDNEIEDTASESDSGKNSENGSVDGSGNGDSQEPADDGVVRILLVERSTGEADPFAELFETTDYQIDRACVSDQDFPATAEELFIYDEIVLNNIANADMPDGFADLLYSYVNDFGGGLFTVGGDDENGEQHSYLGADLLGTRYGDLLPVTPQQYMPPLGVMMIVDRSGSMGMTDDLGQTRLEHAKQGAEVVLDALTEGDYCGVMSMEGTFFEHISLTPVTQRSELRETIFNIGDCGGGTVWGDALRRAGQSLVALRDVENRHVVVFTDGLPSDSYSEYSPILEEFVQKGVTFSFVVIAEDLGNSEKSTLQNAAAVGGGRCYFVNGENALQQAAHAEMSVPALREEDSSAFTIAAEMPDSPVLNGVELPLSVTLDGCYASKAKDGAEIVLSGKYGYPVYAHWSVGKGKVGSFLCDLGGARSKEFLASESGRLTVRNIVAYLLR